MREFEAHKLMDKDRRWSVVWYRLEATNDLVDITGPAIVPITPLFDGRRISFWPPAPRQKGPQKPPAPKMPSPGGSPVVFGPSLAPAPEPTDQPSGDDGAGPPPAAPAHEPEQDATVEELLAALEAPDENALKGGPLEDGLWPDPIMKELDETVLKKFHEAMVDKFIEELAPADDRDGVPAGGDEVATPAASGPSSGSAGAPSGPSSSAAGAPPEVAVVAADPPAKKPRVCGARKEAAFTVDVYGGKICYYEGSENFVAYCGNPAHGKCELTRTSRASKHRVGPGFSQGRPLGFMMAWLDQCYACDTKEDHWKKEVFEQDYPIRLKARAHLLTMPNGEELTKFERCADTVGADYEPRTLNGLMGGIK